MIVNLIPMDDPAKGYLLTSPQTQSIFSVWEFKGGFFYATIGVRRPIERLGSRLEVESLEEAAEKVRREYESFFHAEILFLLSIDLHSKGYRLTSFFEENHLVKTDFFNRFSLLDYQKSRSLPDWLVPFMEELQCIKKVA